MTEEKEWLIRKGGYYYRPNRSGYTAHPIEAGRYTEDEARVEASVEPWHMRAVHISEVMEMTDKEGTETRRYGPPVSREEFYEVKEKLLEANATIVRLVDRVNALEGARKETPPADSDGWIPHDGGKCPVGPSAIVEVRLRDNEPAMGPRTDWAKHFVWRHSGGKYDITHYRPAKQEAEWPQVGDNVCFLTGTGEIVPTVWMDRQWQRDARDFTGAYPNREQTEEAAAKIRRIMEHLRNGEQVILATDTRMVTAEKVEL